MNGVVVVLVPGIGVAAVMIPFSVRVLRRCLAVFGSPKVQALFGQALDLCAHGERATAFKKKTLLSPKKLETPKRSEEGEAGSESRRSQDLAA